MYLEHFGLSVNPFGISPRLDFLYKSGAFEESMAHLVFGLDNSEAIVMITGAIGTGKTMAIQSFLSHLGDRYLTALITNTSVDGRELLKLILDDLGAPVDSRADKSDLLIAFKKFVIAAGREGKRIVIVIDEAQNLSREVLEEIRQLTNLGQGEEQPVQIILVGQPELEANVERPDLAQLKQRIRVHYKLAPLSRDELEEYVDHRMQVAGGRAGIFSGRALDRIYQLSGGVPRVVNTLCIEALLSALVAGRQKVEAADLNDQAAPPTDSAGEAPPVIVADKPVLEARAGGPGLPAAAAATGGSAVRGDTAARREAKPAPVRRAKQPSPVRGAKRTNRGRNLVLAAVAVVTGGIMLGVTGRLDLLWSNLPLVGAGDRVEALQSSVVEPTPVVNESIVGLVPAEADTVASQQLIVAKAGPAPIDSVKASPVSARQEAPQPAPGTNLEPADRELTAASAAPAIGGEHYIHVSSFRTAEHAADVASQFTKRGLTATVRQQTVRESLWYRVYLGPYGSHDDAVRLANSLRDEGAITYYKVVLLGAEEGL